MLTPTSLTLSLESVDLIKKMVSYFKKWQDTDVIAQEQASEINRTVHIFWHQYLLHWKKCQQSHRESADCDDRWNRSYGNLISQMKYNAIYSKPCTVWMHNLDPNKKHGEKKVRWELRTNATCSFEKNLDAAKNSRFTAVYFPSHKPSKEEKQEMLGIYGKLRTKSWVTFLQDTHIWMRQYSPTSKDLYTLTQDAE